MTHSPEPPSVSVVMPLYNGMAFLDAAVESVLDQTFESWELLIVDDGSSDDSAAGATAWTTRDDRISLLRHPGGVNRGVSATRNLGVRCCRSERVALLDCDDLWSPDKLERQMKIAVQNPDVVLIYSKAQVIDDRGDDVTEARPGMSRPTVFGNGEAGRPMRDFEGYLQSKYWIPASSVLFTKTAAADCGLFDESLGYQVEDTLLWARLAEKGPMWFQDEVLIRYRVHGSQWNSRMSASRKWQSRFAYLDALHCGVSPERRPLTAERLVDYGFAGLAKSLISPWELHALRLSGYWGRLLVHPLLPAARKLRATGIYARQLLLSPIRVLQFAKRSVLGPR